MWCHQANFGLPDGSSPGLAALPDQCPAFAGSGYDPFQPLALLLNQIWKCKTTTKLLAASCRPFSVMERVLVCVLAAILVWCWVLCDGMKNTWRVEYPQSLSLCLQLSVSVSVYLSLFLSLIIIIIIIINPLSARVVGAPQMVLQPVLSIFPLFSTALWDFPKSRPVRSLMLSSHLFLCFVFFTLSLCLARWFWPDLVNRKHDHTTAVCVSLQSSVGLRVVQLPAGSWHGLPRWYHGLCMRCVVPCGSTSFPWFVFFFGVLLWGSMIHKLTGRWMWQGYMWQEIHQSYLGAERNTLVNPNWFQPCQCCCCLCYPGELGTLISDKWAQVLEVCDCLKLLSIHFDLCVDATGVVCHQLGLLGTDLHVVGCGGFVKTLS